jgi:uncharacterized protein (DUF4415 family)
MAKNPFDNKEDENSETATKVAELPKLKKKKPAKEPIHIFFDPDVLKVIKKKQKDNGNGWKSNYVNDLVRKAFEQEGWIDPQ